MYLSPLEPSLGLYSSLIVLMNILRDEKKLLVYEFLKSREVVRGQEHVSREPLQQKLIRRMKNTNRILLRAVVGSREGMMRMIERRRLRMVCDIGEELFVSLLLCLIEHGGVGVGLLESIGFINAEARRCDRIAWKNYSAR
jgi:hypothetical protein